MVSDWSLLRRYREGSQEAAASLYERYAARLRALAEAKFSAPLARRVDVEDIVQSVFRRFFRAVDRGNYALPGGEDLWAVLMVFALNRIRNEAHFQQAARRDVRRTSGLDTAADVPGGASPDRFTEGLVRLVLDEALARLPAHFVTALRLRVEGYEVAEIAALTARSKRTVERILQDARTRLLALLDEEASDDQTGDGSEVAGRR